MTFNELPIWFIKSSLTDYQIQGIEVKYIIFTHVENSKNKSKAFIELEDIVNLNNYVIKNIYYALKKRTKRFQG